MAKNEVQENPFVEVDSLAAQYGVRYYPYTPDWYEFFLKDIEAAKVAAEKQKVVEALGAVGAYDAQFAVDGDWIAPGHPMVVDLLSEAQEAEQNWNTSGFTTEEAEHARLQVVGAQAARVAVAA